MNYTPEINTVVFTAFFFFFFKKGKTQTSTRLNEQLINYVQPQDMTGYFNLYIMSASSDYLSVIRDD